jgi:hypothetical protein
MRSSCAVGSHDKVRLALISRVKPLFIARLVVLALAGAVVTDRVVSGLYFTAGCAFIGALGFFLAFHFWGDE